MLGPGRAARILDVKRQADLPKGATAVEAVSFDLLGSYETGFNESDDNARQWVLPNVIVVRARRP